MLSLKGKVAIITGSEGDIGKALVKKFKKEGATVYGFDSKNRDDITAWEVIRKKIDKIAKKEKHIDILINNAGIHNVIEDKKYYYPYQIIDINLIAPEFLTRRVSKYMIKGGSVINITSLRSEVAGENNPYYGATKGGLKILTKCLARDYAPKNIRVNNVGFGYIKTAMTTHGWTHNRKKIEDRTMLGRWGKPEDVTGMIAFLCTPEASYITGTDIYIDGGFLAKGL